MARFRAIIQGQRGEVSRLGSKASGLTVKVNGWNLGVEIDGAVDAADADFFEVYATPGSSPQGKETYLGTVKLVDGVPTLQQRRSQ